MQQGPAKFFLGPGSHSATSQRLTKYGRIATWDKILRSLPRLSIYRSAEILSFLTRDLVWFYEIPSIFYSIWWEQSILAWGPVELCKSYPEERRRERIIQSLATQSVVCVALLCSKESSYVGRALLSQRLARFFFFIFLTVECKIPGVGKWLNSANSIFISKL